MTDAQWYFEYLAQRKKEEAESKVHVEVIKTAQRIFHDTLVGILGLNQLVPKDEGADDAPDAPLRFVPGIWAFGNHHLLSAHMEANKKGDDAAAALQDDAFEEFSKKLARGDTTGINPILLGQHPQLQHNPAAERAKLHAMYGVTMRPADAPAVAHFGVRKTATAQVEVEVLDSEQMLDTTSTPDAIEKPLVQVKGPSAMPLPDDTPAFSVRLELEPGVYVGEEPDGDG